jgi:hypothetical protein
LKRLAIKYVDSLSSSTVKHNSPYIVGYTGYRYQICRDKMPPSTSMSLRTELSYSF